MFKKHSARYCSFSDDTNEEFVCCKSRVLKHSQGMKSFMVEWTSLLSLFWIPILSPYPEAYTFLTCFFKKEEYALVAKGQKEGKLLTKGLFALAKKLSHSKVRWGPFHWRLWIIIYPLVQCRQVDVSQLSILALQEKDWPKATQKSFFT